MTDPARLVAFRRKKDNFFRASPQSPLTSEQQAAFTGLRYYDANPSLALAVELDLVNGEEQILMKTNRDELRPFFRHGTFDVLGATLTVYRSVDGAHYFLPFADGDAGSETYGAGRYLDLTPDDDDGDAFVVDFNYAYNPYCAYNNLYVCPVTPAENRIDVSIPAGERLPQGDWVVA